MARLVVALAAVLLSISVGAAVTVWPAFAEVLLLMLVVVVVFVTDV